jgi:hypothetical protein
MKRYEDIFDATRPRSSAFRLGLFAAIVAAAILAARFIISKQRPG